MAKNKEENASINYKGIDYELVFNLNVMEDIQNEYGTVEAWGELVENAAEPKAKDIKYGFMAMLNEGIDIYNEENDDKRPLLTAKQVGRIISEVGLANVTSKIKSTVVDSTKSDEKN